MTIKTAAPTRLPLACLAAGLLLFPAALHAQVAAFGDYTPSPFAFPTWNVSGGLAIGVSGVGVLAITDTGSVSNTIGTLGLFLGSTGVANVTGGNWTNSGPLRVGDLGNGTLNISGNGSVSNTLGLFGGLAGSTGVANVSGGNWINALGLSVGSEGNGTLNISGNGSVSASFVSSFFGSVNLLGGTLVTGQLSEVINRFSGTVTFSGGTLRLTGNQTDRFSGFKAGQVKLTGPGGGAIDTQAFTVAKGKIDEGKINAIILDNIKGKIGEKSTR